MNGGDIIMLGCLALVSVLRKMMLPRYLYDRNTQKMAKRSALGQLTGRTA